MLGCEESTQPEHEAWVDAETRDRLMEADDSNAVWISNEVVIARFQTLNLEVIAEIERVEAEGKARRQTLAENRCPRR